jgi:hypothetical protein
MTHSAMRTASGQAIANAAMNRSRKVIKPSVGHWYSTNLLTRKPKSCTEKTVSTYTINNMPACMVKLPVMWTRVYLFWSPRPKEQA